MITNIYVKRFTEPTVRAEVYGRKWVKSRNLGEVTPPQITLKREQAEMLKKLTFQGPTAPLPRLRDHEVFVEGIAELNFVLTAHIFYGGEAAAVGELGFGFEPGGGEPGRNEVELL